MEINKAATRDQLDRAYEHADEALAALRRVRNQLVQAIGVSPDSQAHLEPVWRLICEADGLLCASLDRMADEYNGDAWGLEDDDE